MITEHNEHFLVTKLGTFEERKLPMLFAGSNWLWCGSCCSFCDWWCCLFSQKFCACAKP